MVLHGAVDLVGARGQGDDDRRHLLGLELRGADLKVFAADLAFDLEGMVDRAVIGDLEPQRLALDLDLLETRAPRGQRDPNGLGE